MIVNIGKLSLWAGNIPLKKQAYLPRFSYLDGGSYWKVSMLWFKFYFELSGLKKNKKKYKQITKEKLDALLKNVNDYDD